MKPKGPKLTPRQKYLRMRINRVGRSIPYAWQEIFERGLMDYDRIMDYVLWGYSLPPAHLMKGYYAKLIRTRYSGRATRTAVHTDV